MKKSPALLALLVMMAPLLFKQKISAAQLNDQAQASNEESQSKISALIREYVSCGKECPQKYKDAIVGQIAKLKNITKKQALAMIVLAILAWKGSKYLTRKKPLGLPPIEKSLIKMQQNG